jgi:hypothetical protein
VSRTWTADEIRALGVRTDIETAASIWGIGRTKAFELAQTGEFPSPVVRVGSRYVVLVTPMLRALGLDQEPDQDVTDSRTPLSLLPDTEPHGSDHRHRGPPAA